jgi:hypothetical protein
LAKKLKIESRAQEGGTFVEDIYQDTLEEGHWLQFQMWGCSKPIVYLQTASLKPGKHTDYSDLPVTATD